MISEHAVIDPSAKIASNVSIDPFSIIGPHVEIGENTWVGPHVVIQGPTRIGRDNKFFQFSSIGEICQDKKYAGEFTRLEIGVRNVFRENCTIHRGTRQGGGVTLIGDDNLFMVSTHVVHDCEIANHVVFSNGASIAGHVKVNNYANLGGFVGVHQFCAIGAFSFSAGGTIIYKDVLPFTKIAGYPAKSFGLNTIGLEREDFTAETIEWLRKAYRIIFRSSGTVKDALLALKPLIEFCQDVQLLYDFLEQSSRGIVR